MTELKYFYHASTNTLTYVVWDPKSMDAVVMDPVCDYDAASSTVSFVSTLDLIHWLQEIKLNLRYILETHAHADHLSGAQYLKNIFPEAKLAIGKRITEVQSTFKQYFDLSNVKTDGSQFDELLTDGQELTAGTLKVSVVSTPGHTPACSCYLTDNRLFTGDLLFMPDSGTGRCDFPGGSAESLFDSVMRIYALPEETLVYAGHDYQPNQRALQYQSTIAEQKSKNIHLNAQTKRDDYINFRKSRDATLSAPKLLLPSVQINIDAGRLPLPHSNGICYLQIPIFIK